MTKCVFLDRDGVLNRDKVDYVYSAEEHIILDGVPEALHLLKEAGYKLVIITNQSGIGKGIYTPKEVLLCYDILQNETGHKIDDIYYCPYHPDFDTETLSRKPGSLMFEKAIAKHKIDVTKSWMVGDRARDLVPAKKLGIKTILVGEEKGVESDLTCTNLLEAAKQILEKTK